MCDQDKSNPVKEARTANRIMDETFGVVGAYKKSSTIEDHTVYELKQQREYHIQQIVKIHAVIDALNRI